METRIVRRYSVEVLPLCGTRDSMQQTIAPLDMVLQLASDFLQECVAKALIDRPCERQQNIEFAIIKRGKRH
jgi:hypothetical protein